MSQITGAGDPCGTVPTAKLLPPPDMAGQAVFDPRTELERARDACMAGHPADGISIAEDLVTQLRDSSACRAEDTEVLGSAYTLLGLMHCLRDEPADESFSRAVQAFRQVPTDRLERGLGVTAADYGIALQHTGAHQQAVMELDRAIELGQDTADVRRYRGAALRDRGEQGDWDQAHKLLANAVQRTPRDWQAQEWLAALTEELDLDPAEAAGQWAAAGRVLSEGRMFERASRDIQRAALQYQRAVRMQPEDPELLLSAGRTMAEARLDTEAARLLKRAAALPAEPRARLDIAGLLLALGDDVTAAELAEGVLAEDPSNEQAVTRLAEALSTQDDVQSVNQAEEKLTGFLRSHPGSVIAEAELGEINRLRDRPQVAITHFDRALNTGGEQDDAKAAFLHGSKGQALLQLAQPDEAVAELLAAAKRGPELAWIRFALADAYQDTGDPEAASAVLRGLIEQYPPARDWATWLEALIKLGNLLMDAGDQAEALTVLRQIPEPEALSTDVLQPLTTVLLDMGREAEALDVLRDAELAVPDLNVRTLHARVLYWIGRLDEAADLLTGVLDQDGERWRDRAWLGEVERMRGRLPAALAQLDQVLREHPDNTWSRSSRAAVYLRMGELDKAEHDLRPCLDQHPRDLFSLRILRELLTPQDRYRDLVTGFQQAIGAPGPEPDAELWDEYGQALSALVPYQQAADTLREAEEDLAEALGKTPCDLARLRVLRDLLVAQGRFGDAVDIFEHALRSAGAEPNAELQREYGETLRQAGRHADAREALDKALRQSTEKQAPQIRYVLGRLLVDQDRYEEAVVVFDRAAQGSRDPTVWHAGFAARIRAGRYTEAWDRLRWWLDDHPRDADAWWLLGELYYLVGAWQPATAAAASAVRYDPEEAAKHELLGWSILRTGQELPEAQAAFDRAIELDPSQLTSLAGKARAFFIADKGDDMRAACTALLAQLPTEGMQDADVQELRGWCLARLGSPLKAVVEYIRALPEAGEERAVIEFDLALCQFQAGRPQDADSTLKQAWLDLGLARDPKRPLHEPELRRRGIQAEILQELQAALAHDPELRRSRTLGEVRDRLAAELVALPELDDRPAPGP